MSTLREVQIAFAVYVYQSIYFEITLWCVREKTDLLNFTLEI